jgi:transposase InsO family protein
LPSATYYRWIERESDGALTDEVITPIRTGLPPMPMEEAAVCQYARAHARTGYKKLTWLMVDENVAFLGPNQVYEVLQKYDAMSQRGTQSAALLNRPPEPQRPDERWHVDIMYLLVDVRWCYLVDILDAYSRYLVHWTLNLTMTADTLTLTVQTALDQLRDRGADGFNQSLRPEIVHDNGSQFVSAEWRRLVAGTAIKDIATKVAHPQSNGRLERLHRSHREEGLIDADLGGYYSAQEALANWSRFYNQRRPHAALQYLCPVDYYRGDPTARRQERAAKLERAKQLRHAYWEANGNLKKGAPGLRS